MAPIALDRPAGQEPSGDIPMGQEEMPRMHASAQRQGRCEHCTVRRCAGADVCVGSTGGHTACSCSEMAGSVRRHIAERVAGDSGVATAGSCLESIGSCVQTALSCSEMAGTVQGAWTAWRLDRRAHGREDCGAVT